MWIVEVAFNEQQYKSFSWELIESFIRSMDGSKADLLLYGPREDLEIMAISGGNDDRYLVSVQEVAQKYFLSNPEQGLEKVLIRSACCGDELIAAELAQGIDATLLVAKAYAEKGERDFKFEWKKDPEFSKGPLMPGFPIINVTCKNCGITFEHTNPNVRGCYECYLLQREARRNEARRKDESN